MYWQYATQMRRARPGGRLWSRLGTSGLWRVQGGQGQPFLTQGFTAIYASQGACSAGGGCRMGTLRYDRRMGFLCKSDYSRSICRDALAGRPVLGNPFLLQFCGTEAYFDFPQQKKFSEIRQINSNWNPSFGRGKYGNTNQWCISAIHIPEIKIQNQMQESLQRMLDSSRAEEVGSICKLEPTQDADESSVTPLKKRQNRCRDKELKGMNIGHWSELEKKLYFVFLMEHQSHFFNREMRRLDKIFKAMANFIGTRAADQCRSHHQKIQKKYHTFDNILLSLQKLHEETVTVTVIPPVKVEADQPPPAIKDMFDQPFEKHQLFTPLKLEALKPDPMDRLYTSSTLGLQRRPIETDWNLGEGLDQLHYL